MSCCQLILPRLCQSYLYPPEPAGQIPPQETEPGCLLHNFSSTLLNYLWEEITVCVVVFPLHWNSLPSTQGRKTLPSVRQTSVLSSCLKSSLWFENSVWNTAAYYMVLNTSSYPSPAADNIRLCGLLPAVGRSLSMDHAGPLSVLRYVTLRSEVHLETAGLEHRRQLQVTDM